MSDNVQPAEEKPVADGQIIGSRPASVIPSTEFDKARGRPASIRPPSSSSISFADLEREDVEVRVSEKLKRKVTFSPDDPIETIKKIGELIVKRKIPSVEEAEKAIPLFLKAIEPDTYRTFVFTDLKGQDLWDLLFAQLSEMGPKTAEIADNISRVYAREMLKRRTG